MAIAQKPTVLISGGTSGIGRATVFLLLQRGFRVATFSSDARKARTLQQELAKRFSAEQFLVGVADVTRPSEVTRFLVQTRRHLKTIDILINNAGYGLFVEADKVDLAA